MSNLTVSNMYCTQCGKKNIPIPRKRGQEREPGHLKQMYCIYCKKKQNMVEIKEMGSGYTENDFKLEFNLHNFNEDGTRKLTWSEFRIHLNKGGGVLE